MGHWFLAGGQNFVWRPLATATNNTMWETVTFRIIANSTETLLLVLRFFVDGCETFFIFVMTSPLGLEGKVSMF